MASCSKPSEWREIIRNEALRIGFDACGFARVEEVDVDMRDSYRQWLASGKQAQMGYLDNYVELRDNPALLYPGARTMICVALNYYPVRFQSGESPRFAYYAVVKCGAQGSFVGCEGIITEVPATPEVRVDSTGAGDLYASGFLYGLSQNCSLGVCGAIGSLLAGRVIKVIGTKMSDEIWTEIKLKVSSMVAEDIRH